MIDLTHAGIADDDTLGQPSAADFQRAGAQPLDSTERARLQSKIEDLRRGPAPSEWVLPLAASVEARGQTSLAAELRAQAADASVEWLAGEMFRVPSGDQLWIRLLGLPGRASVWVDDRRVGPVASGEDSGWAILT